MARIPRGPEVGPVVEGRGARFTVSGRGGADTGRHGLFEAGQGAGEATALRILKAAMATGVRGAVVEEKGMPGVPTGMSLSSTTPPLVDDNILASAPFPDAQRHTQGRKE